jgi:hypothetical protein
MPELARRAENLVRRSNDPARSHLAQRRNVRGTNAACAFQHGTTTLRVSVHQRLPGSSQGSRSLYSERKVTFLLVTHPPALDAPALYRFEIRNGGNIAAFYVGETATLAPIA